MRKWRTPQGCPLSITRAVGRGVRLVSVAPGQGPKGRAATWMEGRRLFQHQPLRLTSVGGAQRDGVHTARQVGHIEYVRIADHAFVHQLT